MLCCYKFYSNFVVSIAASLPQVLMHFCQEYCCNFVLINIVVSLQGFCWKVDTILMEIRCLSTAKFNRFLDVLMLPFCCSGAIIKINQIRDLKIKYEIYIKLMNNV
jgi:hypothetical protein